MFDSRFFIIGVLLAPSWLFADVEQPRDVIIVTATRSEMTLTDTIVPVTVIGRDRIEQSLATDLGELLRFEAGLDIGRNGGPGQATSVFMRGTESNHTLVLVDGVRINPGTIGGAAIQHIDPEIIERVEIVRGSRSSLYGTDAIGGVINIITRRATSNFLEAGGGGGSFGTKTGYLSGGAKSTTGEFGITVNWQDTDGYEISPASNIERGYDNLSANAYARREFGFGDVTLRHWRASGTVEYLDFFLSPLDQDFVNSSTAFELDSPLGERARSKLILSYIVDEIEQNQGDDFVRSERAALDWQYSFDAGQHALAAGVYLTDEDASTLSFGSGFDEETAARAVFAQDFYSHGKHRVFLAGRYTDYDSFGSEFTWNAEYAYDIGERWTVSAGLGHAFRAPDATDRYGFGGNPDLLPEIADEIQLGAEFRPGLRQTLRLELYTNDIEDLIEFDLADFTLRNIGRAEIRGAQLGYEYNGDGFTLKADLLKQSAENATDGMRLLRRPEESLTVSYLQNIGRHRFGIAVLASGDREDFGATLPGYVLTNVTGQIAVNDQWQLNLRVENVFDRDYETAANFRMQGRSAYAELKYRWQ